MQNYLYNYKTRLVKEHNDIEVVSSFNKQNIFFLSETVHFLSK